MFNAGAEALEPRCHDLRSGAQRLAKSRLFLHVAEEVEERRLPGTATPADDEGLEPERTHVCVER